MHTIPPNICSLDIPKTSLTIEGNTGGEEELSNQFCPSVCLPACVPLGLIIMFVCIKLLGLIELPKVACNSCT